MSKKCNRFRNTYINVPLTIAEKQMILDRMKRCGVKNTSEYMRIMAIDGCIFFVDDSEKLEKIAYEMHKIGVNINQMAHVANSAQTISPAEIKIVQEKQEQLWQLLKSILLDSQPYLQ